MIMNGRASLRLPSAGLLALALLSAATLPAWATATGDDVPQQAQSPSLTQVTPKTPPPPPPTPAKPKAVVKVEPQKKPVIRDETVTHIVAVKPNHPQAKWIQKDGVTSQYWVHTKPETLTDEGQKLVTDYSTDLEAIQKEMQAKTEARREAVIQSLQSLQDQYTKAGKLDEALAIRDYLKAGGPAGSGHYYWFTYNEKK